MLVEIGDWFELTVRVIEVPWLLNLLGAKREVEIGISPVLIERKVLDFLPLRCSHRRGVVRVMDRPSLSGLLYCYTSESAIVPFEALVIQIIHLTLGSQYSEMVPKYLLQNSAVQSLLDE